MHFTDGKNMLTYEGVVTLDTSAAATCDRLLQCGHQPLQLNFRSESCSPTYSGEQTSTSASVVRTAELKCQILTHISSRPCSSLDQK